jgi:hypothetical protein
LLQARCESSRRNVCGRIVAAPSIKARFSELKRHAARLHPGSILFALSDANPHRDCAPCAALMRSYERMFAEHDEAETKNIWDRFYKT